MVDAERLRERITQLNCQCHGSVGRLTVSIGVAQYKPGGTIVQTFARADRALYGAKQRGRNYCAGLVSAGSHRTRRVALLGPGPFGRSENEPKGDLACSPMSDCGPRGWLRPR